MARVRGLKWVCGLFLVYAVTAIPACSQTFAVLAGFNPESGTEPGYISLVQGRDGAFYGTTSHWGDYSYGSIFRVTRTGALTELHAFNSTDGCCIVAGLILSTDGNFYGTSLGDGAHGGGTVFRISPVGTLTTLYDFCAQANCADGATPIAGLLYGSDGNFYGTTYGGGNAQCTSGCGTVFRITPSGSLTTLYTFCSQTNCSDGASPYAGLVQATNGNFYGVTSAGANGFGTIYKITQKGTLTTLYTFCSQINCADGATPYGTLVQSTDGNLYGTTYQGGTNCLSVGGCGTVFKLPVHGALATLYSFGGSSTDGAYPNAGLIQGTDGNFYGTTYGGGGSSDCGGGCGTAFKITSAGMVSNLHNFDYSDGEYLYGGLLQATDGNFYGVTDGGNAGVFRLGTGARPFIAFVRNYGKVGQTTGILGQGFIGTTSVSLNGIQASFKVVSDTFMNAIVPAGATTGAVTVTTPHGTLTSNVPFRVTP